MGVLIVDKGWNGIRNNFGAMRNVYTKVGYPMESAKTREPKKAGGGKATRLTVGEIAAVLEDGTRDGRIPARPTLKPAFDKHVKKNFSLCAKLGKAMLNGQLDIEAGLSMIGEANTGYIVEEINQLWAPKLSKRTISARRALGYYSTKPLVHTSQMKSAITHVEVIK